MLQTSTVDGFKRVVFFEDVLILIFGIFIGGFIMTLLVCNVLTKIKVIKNESFDKISFISFVSKDDKKKYFINANKKNIFEIVRGMLLIIFSPSFLLNNYVVKDDKKGKILIRILFVFGLIVSILALLAIFKITIPPPYH